MNVALMTTSKLSSFLLVTLCFSFITTFVAGDNKCTTVGCGCQFTNTTGTYEISLKGLGEPGKPVSVTVGSYWTYHIDPCYEFSYPKSDPSYCKDVTMCQSTPDDQTFPIARIQTKNFGAFDNKTQTIQVKYSKVTGGPKNKNRQMIINLKCGKSVIPPRTVTEDSTADPITYTFTLETTNACPKKVPSRGGGSSSGGPSTGSILVIVFFVVLVIYLVAGILFMKYKRGATGKEVIPNVEFWSSLPGLIKDGCVFFGKKMKELCGRCCNREGYSEI